jgi:hypothetical protein
MATIDYVAEFLVEVEAMLEEFGKPVTIVKWDPTDAVPAEPWLSAVEPRNGAALLTTVNAVAVSPVSLLQLGIELDAREQDGLKRGDVVYVCEPGDDYPDDLHNFDEVRDDDGVRRIVYGSKLKPADVTLLYYLVCKK